MAGTAQPRRTSARADPNELPTDPKHTTIDRPAFTAQGYREVLFAVRRTHRCDKPARPARIRLEEDCRARRGPEASRCHCRSLVV